MNRTAKALRLSHTSAFSEQNWEQGGSREQLEVSILPRDCE